MGSVKKLLWLIFLLEVIFVVQPLFKKSQSVSSIGFRARIYHQDYNPQLSTAHDLYYVMINHSISRLHYFGHSLTEEPVNYIFSGKMGYITEFNIGTNPSKTFHFNIDIGSHITWVRHKNCTTCKINEMDISYNDKSSASAKDILCHKKECDEDEIIKCHGYSNRCSYSIPYHDGSNSSGLMYLDSFSFLSINESTVVLENVRFGGAFYCKESESAYHHDVEGVFALSRNRRSFISQKGISKFSYCLPSYKHMVEGSTVVLSTMMFGTEASLVGDSTAMVSNPNYYIVSLNGISVGGMRLELDQSIFWQRNGQGNTIVDMGTPISFMPEKAYNEVVKTLGSMIELPRIAYDNNDTLCFKGGLKDIDKHVPSMTLHFEGLDLPITPRSLFFVLPDEVMCLTMLPMRHGDEYSIFGASLQQNINIAFDTGNNKIFMSPMTCS